MSFCRMLPPAVPVSNSFSVNSNGDKIHTSPLMSMRGLTTPSDVIFCLGPRIANVNKEVCFEERSSQENLLLPRQFIPDGDIQLHTHTHTQLSKIGKRLARDT